MKAKRIRKHFEMACSYEEMLEDVNTFNNEVMQNLAHTIKQERLKKKVSLRDLCKVTKVSIKTIKDFESCKSMPKLDVISKLACALGLDLKSLYCSGLPKIESVEAHTIEQRLEKIRNRFYMTFKIKPRTYYGVYYSHTDYPQFTPERVLKLICLAFDTYGKIESSYSKLSVEELELEVLKVLMLAQDDVYKQVEEIFEGD